MYCYLNVYVLPTAMLPAQHVRLMGFCYGWSDNLELSDYLQSSDSSINSFKHLLKIFLFV